MKPRRQKKTLYERSPLHHRSRLHRSCCLFCHWTPLCLPYTGAMESADYGTRLSFFYKPNRRRFTMCHSCNCVDIMVHNACLKLTGKYKKKITNSSPRFKNSSPRFKTEKKLLENESIENINHCGICFVSHVLVHGTPTLRDSVPIPVGSPQARPFPDPGRALPTSRLSFPCHSRIPGPHRRLSRSSCCSDQPR